MLLEVVVVWLVVSPVVGVALGVAIARAARLAESGGRHRLAPVAAHAAPAVAEPADEPVSAAAPEPAEAAPHAALKLLTDVPAPRSAPSLDDVLHLRLKTGPES